MIKLLVRWQGVIPGKWGVIVAIGLAPTRGKSMTKQGLKRTAPPMPKLLAIVATSMATGAWCAVVSKVCG